MRVAAGATCLVLAAHFVDASSLAAQYAALDAAPALRPAARLPLLGAFPSVQEFVPLHPALENAYPLLLHAMRTLPHLLGAATAAGAPAAAASGRGASGGGGARSGGGGGGGGGGGRSPYAECARGTALAGVGADLAERTAADPAQVGAARPA
jgi:hypothetical protein